MLSNLLLYLSFLLHWKDKVGVKAPSALLYPLPQTAVEMRYAHDLQKTHHLCKGNCAQN